MNTATAEWRNERDQFRVAVAWSPEHVLPLSGTYSGPPGSFIPMDVDVRVTEPSESPASRLPG